MMRAVESARKNRRKRLPPNFARNPMAMFGPERVALPESGVKWVGRNTVAQQDAQRREQFYVGVRLPADRIRQLGMPGGCTQSFQLVDQQGVRQQRPPMPPQHRLQRHLAFDRRVRVARDAIGDCRDSCHKFVGQLNKRVWARRDIPLQQGQKGANAGSRSSSTACTLTVPSWTRKTMRPP